jgi:hypothetical protein
MVLMGTNGLYVMKQGGFCVEGQWRTLLDLCPFLAVMIQQTN